MNVLSLEKLKTLRERFIAGHGQRQIERDTGISNNTIRWWWNVWTHGFDLAAVRAEIVEDGRRASALGGARACRSQAWPLQTEEAKMTFEEMQENPCPKCGHKDAYICDSPRRNGATRLRCRNAGCRADFTTLTGTPWAATKLAPAVRERIEELWRAGVHPSGISRIMGLQYKTVWFACKRLSAASC